MISARLFFNTFLTLVSLSMTTSTPEAELLAKIYSTTKSITACQLKYARLETANKLSSLLTVFTLIIVGINLAVCLLIFLTFQLAFLIASAWGRLSLAILAIVGIYLMFGSLLYYNRKRWILHPITRLFLHTFNLHEEALCSNPTAEVERQKSLTLDELKKQRECLNATLNNAATEMHRPSITEALTLFAKYGNSLYNGLKMGFDFIKKRRGA